ncbi:MAG: DUF222 domain-containing protein [Nocardioidaceae bacterium]|nr:DUF222 domain-containing protein [Nocardioidaceae bacterium]
MPQPPLLACIEAIERALDGVRGVDPAYLSADDKAAALLRLHRAGERLHATKLALLAAATDVAEADASRSPGAWLDKHTACGHREATRQERLGHALAEKWTATGSALAEGLLTREHAEAIVSALDRLPAGLDPALVQACEKELVALADHFDPKGLRRVGKTILSRVAPEVGDEHDRRALEAEERQARKHTWLAFHRAGDGTTYLRGRVPDATAATFRTVLEAFTAPRRHAVAPVADGAGEVDRLPFDQRLGIALCALLDRLPEQVLPEHGGTATTVNVLIDLQTLLSGLGTATLADGTPITAGTARRLACTAHLVPVVLGTDSEILDLGRRSRLYTRAQRHAMALRDRQCRAAGCTIPPAWCEAHHLRSWSRGGRTDLDDGILLCTFHHHRIHDERYHHTLTADRRVEFHRRT